MGERLTGDVDWAHPKEHLWRVRDEEGCTCVVAQGEAIPIMGAFGGPLRRTAREDACPGNIVRDSALVTELCQTCTPLTPVWAGVPAISSCAVPDCGCV